MRGRKITLYENWYIAVSSWDGRMSANTCSLSVGQYKTKPDGKLMLKGAIRRYRFYPGSAESKREALEEAKFYLRSKGEVC
jgi:hypothetical protein